MKNSNRYTSLAILLLAIIYVGRLWSNDNCTKGVASVCLYRSTRKLWWLGSPLAYYTGDSAWEAHGELIAIHPSQIFIFSGQELTHISIDSITYIKLTIVQLSRDVDLDKHRQMMYPVKPLDEFRAYARFSTRAA